VNELQVNFARGADIFFVFSVPPEKSQDKEKFRLMENRLNSSTHSQSSEKENRTKICSKNCNVISTDQILMHCLC
jgi:hypothetical protein